MSSPPVWSSAELEQARIEAIRLFREQRLEEPLEAYVEAFDDYQGVMEDLLEHTVDLTALSQHALTILTDERLLEGLRYLTGPPISEDDLKIVAEAVLSVSRLRADALMVQRIVQVIRDGLDRRRFPWISEGREPSEAERNAATVASAALIAMRKTETARRSTVKSSQEDLVELTLLSIGLTKVTTREIKNQFQAPQPGEFCRESPLGDRKADFIVRLWDGRILPLECKVSNSSTNSIKRLNNDAAATARHWILEFGMRNVVPGAVLSGVYKLHNLEQAQRSGLTIYWAHAFQPLTDFIQSTKA